MWAHPALHFYRPGLSEVTVQTQTGHGSGYGEMTFGYFLGMILKLLLMSCVINFWYQ